MKVAVQNIDKRFHCMQFLVLWSCLLTKTQMAILAEHVSPSIAKRTYISAKRNIQAKS